MAAGRDPDRDGGRVTEDPEAALVRGAFDETAPVRRVMVNPSVGASERDAPDRIAGKGERDRFDDPIELVRSRLPRSSRPVRRGSPSILPERRQRPSRLSLPATSCVRGSNRRGDATSAGFACQA
jgi:hypothetical protein